MPGKIAGKIDLARTSGGSDESGQRLVSAMAAGMIDLARYLAQHLARILGLKTNDNFDIPLLPDKIIINTRYT